MREAEIPVLLESSPMRIKILLDLKPRFKV
jgi:hypothetical protein